jgi:3-methyladenine DNA glycosylase/8-oxoguanine DNA glycosylase
MKPSPTDPHEAALQHLSAANPRLAELIARVGPCPIRAGGGYGAGPGGADKYADDHFAGLVQAIVSQQLSSKAAITIYERVRQIGLDEEGRLSPARFLAAPDTRLREAGLSGNKTKFVKDLSDRVHGGALQLAAMDALGDEAVIEALCEVKGIGRWTAEMFLIFRLGRLDVLPVDDLGIQKGFVELFNLRKMPTPERMTALARPFRPYRSIASWYLWRLLEKQPKSD